MGLLRGAQQRWKASSSWAEAWLFLRSQEEEGWRGRSDGQDARSARAATSDG